MRFNKFLTEQDVFGFESPDADYGERSPNVDHQTKPQDFLPIKPLDTEYICDLLQKSHLGNKRPHRLFPDSVQWGVGHGAIKLKFGTGKNVIIERMSHSLYGEQTWVTKGIYNTKRDRLGTTEHKVSENIWGRLKSINETPADSPSSKIDNLQHLVVKIANKLKQDVNDPLFFNNITKINENKFIITFNVRGQGVQSPGQQRLEQAHILIEFAQDGIIHINQTDIHSPISERKWEVSHSNYILNFMPNQNVNEIIESLNTIMKYY